MSGIGQYLTICTGQLVEFSGSDLQSSGPSHIAFLINLGLNNYSKATNVDRYEHRGFYRHSKLTNFGAFRNIWSFIEPDFKIDSLKTISFKYTR
jgi:hypothetical protein